MFRPILANYSCKRAACPVPFPRQGMLEIRPLEAARCTAHDRLACRSLRRPPKSRGEALASPARPAWEAKRPKPLHPPARTRSSNLPPTLANTFVNLMMCLSSVSRNLFLQSLPRPAPAGRSRSSSTSPRAGACLTASQPGQASAGRQGAECGSDSRTQPRRPTQGVGWSAVVGPPPPLERSC